MISARTVDVNRPLEAVRALGRRSRRVLLLAGITGAATGAAVAAFEWLTLQNIFERIIEGPLWVQAGAPIVGLTLAWVALRTLGRGTSPATSDEYIRNFHEPNRRLDLAPLPGKITAGIATLGFGGALGYEGPSLYLGASIGAWLQRRLNIRFTREDAKLLMVAGAAAGVAAIFKAPATGAVFALEVPYQDDSAKRMLLPALTAAITGYLVFVTLIGTERLFPVSGQPPFDLRDLLGAAVLGLVCGLGGRLYSSLVRAAKGWATTTPWIRIPAAGIVLAGLFVLSEQAFGEGLSLGAGYRAIEWAVDPERAVGLVLLLLGIRVVATAATLGGGGSGGLFIPLVVAGALVGRVAASITGDTTTTLFPLIGVAAFLSAGYRTPLAGVMFVAESTGRPGFIVPGVIASVVAQLVMGRSSVSPYQQSARVGHLDRRFSLPISAAITADVRTVPTSATLREFYDFHLLLARRLTVPVVDGNDFVGLVSAAALTEVDRSEWDATTVGDITDTEVPRAEPGWLLRDAVVAMESSGLEVLPVVDNDGGFVGIVTKTDIVRLDEILDDAAREAPT